MSEDNENINFLDNEGIFYSLVVEWLKLEDSEQGKINLFIIENFRNKGNPNCNNPYFLGAHRKQAESFLKEIRDYDYVNPIKIKMCNLFDEIGIKFHETLHDQDLDFNVGEKSKEEREFFLMYLFLSLVREYFLILPKVEISLKQELHKATPNGFFGWLLYPLTLLSTLFLYFMEKSASDEEHNPKRIAENEYRVSKIIRKIEKQMEEIEAQERKERMQFDAKRKKQEILKDLISSVNDL